METQNTSISRAEQKERAMAELEAQFTPIEQIPALVDRHRLEFSTQKTKALQWRKRQLSQLKKLVDEKEDEIYQALLADLHKCPADAYACEVASTIHDLEKAIKSVEKWMKPTPVSTPWVLIKGLSKSVVVHEPKGVVLIISPWNYPLNLITQPLIGAIAAGNCAVIKPSEYAPAMSRFFARYIPEYMDSECISVVQGGIPQSTALLAQRWDHIFFTGSPHVGRIVAEAAAPHLTPTTLELGGKSPCIVDATADLRNAAKRIVIGKFMNAGQTCVAPDYLLVERSKEAELRALMIQTIQEFYTANPQASPDFCRLISRRHCQRLIDLLNEGGFDVMHGGQHDIDDLYVAPTLVHTTLDSPARLMHEEIFGPIFPIIPLDGVVLQAIRFINSRPKPLALYIFSESNENQQRILSDTSSGGACINDTILQLTVPDLPFGGVGESGMGMYHGKWSFDEFSHHRGTLFKTKLFDSATRYPPFDEKKFKTLKAVW